MHLQKVGFFCIVNKSTRMQVHRYVWLDRMSNSVVKPHGLCILCWNMASVHLLLSSKDYIRLDTVRYTFVLNHGGNVLFSGMGIQFVELSVHLPYEGHFNRRNRHSVASETACWKCLQWCCLAILWRQNFLCWPTCISMFGWTLYLLTVGACGSWLLLRLDGKWLCQ